MNNILINNTQKKYVKKTFLNFKKDQLIENLKHEIINEDLEKSFYLLFDMINSGFFKDIWIIFFSIYIEYIHFMNPSLLQIIHINFQRYQQMKKNASRNNLNILEARNEFNFRKILYMILKKIVKTPKKHIGYFIPQCFNNQNKITSHTPLLNVFDGKNIPNLNILKEVINNQDYKDVEHALKEFHHYVEMSIHKKFTFDQQQYESKENCFFWLAKILVVGAENTNIIGYPYNISLYHSVDPNSKDYFAPIIWNIILNGSKKLGKDYFKHLVSLYKIFNSRILQKTKRENFLIIQGILFFFEHVTWNPTNISLNQDDYMLIDTLYKKYEQTTPTKPEIKLKSQDLIDDSKDDIEKMIERRKKEVEKLLPPPPYKYKFSEIKKGKKGKKDLVIRDEEEEELPEILFTYHPPSRSDTKICNYMNACKNRVTIPIYKNITIDGSKMKKMNKVKVTVTKNQ